MKRTLLACLLAGPLACGEQDGEVDPLDAELIDALAKARGDGNGSEHSGSWQFEYTLDSCDCPTITVEDLSHDLCQLDAALLMGVHVVDQVGGILAITTEQGVLSGAIEADASFVVASHHDATTVLGVLESLRRLDGAFGNTNTASGWAGQRLIGELAGQPIDCRWIGSFVAGRI